MNIYRVMTRNVSEWFKEESTLQNYGTLGRGGYRPTPSESRNGGIVAYHP
jgi:hypothetical protein